jgi:imidazolonepropionase-like amidohydrolase
MKALTSFYKTKMTSLALNKPALTSSLFLKTLSSCVLSVTLFSSAYAHDMVPGKVPANPVLFQNATLHTATDGIKADHDMVVDNGKIIAIGKGLTVPENADVLDMTGKHIYPGLIALSTTIGLVEIGAVRATNDQRETGGLTPEVEAYVAFNADSEIIPTVRANGITHAEVAPLGNGQASVMQLDGWNSPDSVVKKNSAMHLNWPRAGINKSFWERRSVEKQKEDNLKRLTDLEKTFELVKVYHQTRSNDPSSSIDVRWEAMRSVISGDMPLFIHANDYRQMEQAIAFAKRHSLKIVLVGGADATLAIDLLKSSKTPLIYTSPWGIPRKSDQAYDVAYQIPAMLEQNGIPFALAIEGYWNVRSLPFAAGQSVAHGASKEQALRSVTIEPARILGIDDIAGSLDVGKQANIVVSEGDLFDHLTHKVTMMMIEGRVVDLNSRHTQLYDKYKQKEAE